MGKTSPDPVSECPTYASLQLPGVPRCRWLPETCQGSRAGSERDVRNEKVGPVQHVERVDHRLEPVTTAEPERTAHAGDENERGERGQRTVADRTQRAGRCRRCGVFRVGGVMALCGGACLCTRTVHRAGRAVCAPHRTMRRSLRIRGAMGVCCLCLPVGGAALVRDEGRQGRDLAREPGTDADPQVPANDTHPSDELSGLSTWNQSRLRRRVAPAGIGAIAGYRYPQPELSNRGRW
jgi:hypothetical protein